MDRLSSSGFLIGSRVAGLVCEQTFSLLETGSWDMWFRILITPEEVILSPLQSKSIPYANAQSKSNKHIWISQESEVTQFWQWPQVGSLIIGTGCWILGSTAGLWAGIQATGDGIPETHGFKPWLSGYSWGHYPDILSLTLITSSPPPPPPPHHHHHHHHTHTHIPSWLSAEQASNH